MTEKFLWNNLIFKFQSNLIFIFYCFFSKFIILFVLNFVHHFFMMALNDPMDPSA